MRWFCIALICVLVCSPTALAKRAKKPDKPIQKLEKPRDIYLTGNRICRKCMWQEEGDIYIRLTNQEGKTGLYRHSDIIGIDTHPIGRRLFIKSIKGVGLPGRIIVPNAFDDEQKPAFAL
jgi:hypothetical protein